MGYTVTDGEFELKTGAEAHKETVLKLIAEWEAEMAVPGLLLEQDSGIER